MRTPSTLAILVIILGVLSGCTDAKFKAAYSGQAFPAYTGVVRELNDFPPAGAFERIGVVVVDAPDHASDDRLKRRLLKEAAGRGADAVIFQGPIKTVPYRDGAMEKRLAAFAIRTR